MLSYKVEGNGNPLLLIHGFGISFLIWKNIAPLLTDKFMVITIELPGIGGSTEIKHNYLAECINQLEKLREHLQIDTWGILAYSLGTIIAEEYINKCPQKINKAVYVFPPILNKIKQETFEQILNMDNKLPTFGNFFLTGKRLEWLIKQIGFNGEDNQEIYVWYKEISSQKLHVLKQSLALAKNFDIKKAPNKKILLGVNDFITKGTVLEEAIYINSGHAGIITNASDIATEVIRNLTQAR